MKDNKIDEWDDTGETDKEMKRQNQNAKKQKNFSIHRLQEIIAKKKEFVRRLKLGQLKVISQNQNSNSFIVENQMNQKFIVKNLGSDTEFQMH